MEDPKLDWSSEDLKALLNQALALEFIKFQKEQHPKTEKTWLTILQSNVVATLITVLLGTILGSWLADHIQETNKKNDDERAQKQAAIADERKTVEDAFTTVGKTVAAAQNVIDISGENWDDNNLNLSKDSKQVIIGQKREIWKTYDNAIAEWRVQRERLGLLLTVKHQNPNDMAKAWANLTQRVNDFSACSVKYNLQSEVAVTRPSNVQDACNQQRADLRESLGKLTALTVNATTAK